MADQELIREVYGRFGTACYFSGCLHRGLSVNYAAAPFSNPQTVTGPRVQERMGEAFSLTLGQPAEAMAAWLSEDLRLSLAEATSRRNFLAHHFWYGRAHLMLSQDGLLRMPSRPMTERSGCCAMWGSAGPAVTDPAMEPAPPGQH